MSADLSQRVNAEIVEALVKPHTVERIVWDAMIWAALSPPPAHGAAFPDYRDTGNSDAEFRARQAAAHIASVLHLEKLAALVREMENLLSVYSKPDRQMCCNGMHCGCQGSTVYQEAEHYANAALAAFRGDATGGEAGR